MMEMAKMLGAMLKPSEEELPEIPNEVVQYSPIPFDEELQNQDIKMIKSIIPYMNINQQKIIGVLVKFMEIKNLLEKKEEDIVAIQSENINQWYRNVLMSVQPYCPEDKKHILNIMMRMLELKKILVQMESLKEVL